MPIGFFSISIFVTRVFFISIHFISVRSKAKADFLIEAYGCKNIRLELAMLSDEDIVKMKLNLRNRSLSRTKPPQQKFIKAPVPIVEVEVSTTDSN